MRRQNTRGGWGEATRWTVLLVVGAMLPVTAAAAGGAATMQDAVAIATDVLPGGTTDGLRLYVTPQPIEAGATVSTCKAPVYEAPSQGWFLFVDLHPMANWEHACWYLFVDANTGELSRYEAMVPPAGLADLTEITQGRDNPLPGESEKMHAWLDRGLRARKLKEGDGARDAGRGRGYAFIISGGADMGNNHIRYWNDCSFIYKTLVNYYEYPDENIYVCISDGLDPAPDRSNGTNSPPDLDGDGDDDIQYPATHEYIELVFNELATVLSPNDQLFIFTTDHGGQESGWDCYLNLWNWEELRDDQMAGFVDALPCETVLCCFEQCFSGGMIDDLEGDGRVIATAARWDEYSYAMSGLIYDEFVFYWISAVNWEDPYGNPVDADINNDDVVSMHEAFIYAEAHDQKPETPQYSSTPPDLGDNTSLISNIEGIFLEVANILIDDDAMGASQGNGNGVIEPDEIIELRVALHNAGMENAPDVVATMTSTSSYVTLYETVVDYGPILSGETVAPAQPFVFHVTPDVPDLQDLELVLQVPVAPGVIEVPVAPRAVRFVAEIEEIDDTLGGNGNGLFDPGEDVVLSLSLGNQGGIASPPVSIWLGSGSEYFTTDPTPRDIGVLDPGEMIEEGGFDVSISGQCPDIYTGFLQLHFEGAGHYHAMVQIPVVMGEILVEDMESGAGGWIHYAEPGWQDRWHLETHRNHTPGGTTSWKFGGTGSYPYSNSSYGMLETAPFELPSGSLLSFWHWRQIQETYDGGLLQITTDGGDTWETLTPEGGYPHTINQQGPVGPGPFPTGTGVWSGSAGWEEVVVDLGPYSGDDARLRWVFGSDGSTIYEGWYVDDIYLVNIVGPASSEEPARRIVRPLLMAAQPNPIAGVAAADAGGVLLRFALPEAARGELALFDAGGRLVRVVAQGSWTAGEHRVVWDGRDDRAHPVPAGTYYLRLATGDGEVSRTLTVVR